MTSREAMKKIESHEFAAILNAASDLRTFLRAAQYQEATHILLKELDNPECRKQVLSRIIQLSRQLVDPRYENRWDTALAIYVWLIGLKEPELVKIAALIAMQAPQCWWATKVSYYILQKIQLHNSAEVKQYAFSSHLPVITEKSDAGDSIFPAEFLSNTTNKGNINFHMPIKYNELDDSVTNYESMLNVHDYKIPSTNTQSSTTVLRVPAI